MSSTTLAPTAVNPGRRVAPKLTLEIEDKPVVIEIYEQVDPLNLAGDALIAVVKASGTWHDRIDTLIPSLLRHRHGDHYQAQLKKVDTSSSFSAGQTLMTSGAGLSELPPFKNVLFMSGKNPLSAALDAVFSTADDYGCADVVFALEAFADTESKRTSQSYLNEVLDEVRLSLETLTLTSLRCVKFVLPGAIAE